MFKPQQLAIKTNNDTCKWKQPTLRLPRQKSSTDSSVDSVVDLKQGNLLSNNFLVLLHTEKLIDC